MGGLRAAAALLGVLVLATPTLAAEPGVVAQVAMDRAGHVVWTLELAGTRELRIESGMRMHGDFGEVAVKLFHPGWEGHGGTSGFAYAQGPGASMVVGPIAILPRGSTQDVGTGGGAVALPRDPLHGTMKVVAFAASTGQVTSWNAALRMDNATLVAEEVHEGGTFAFTSRAPPPEYRGGLVGDPPPAWATSPPHGGWTLRATGTLLGDYIVSERDGQRPDLTLSTPSRTRSCPCALEDTPDGPGDYAFGFSGTQRGDAFLAGVDAHLGR